MFPEVLRSQYALTCWNLSHCTWRQACKSRHTSDCPCSGTSPPHHATRQARTKDKCLKDPSIVFFSVFMRQVRVLYSLLPLCSRVLTWRAVAGAVRTIIQLTSFQDAQFTTKFRAWLMPRCSVLFGCIYSRFTTLAGINP